MPGRAEGAASAILAGRSSGGSGRRVQSKASQFGALLVAIRADDGAGNALRTGCAGEIVCVGGDTDGGSAAGAALHAESAASQGSVLIELRIAAATSVDERRHRKIRPIAAQGKP